ncbi:hypothetical protein RB213_008667 [Colletotrichum asianum]
MKGSLKRSALENYLFVLYGANELYALQQYIKATGALESDAWWICKLYNKDQLPTDLNIKLHVNCRDLSLPDNHRQI